VTRVRECRAETLADETGRPGDEHVRLPGLSGDGGRSATALAGGNCGEGVVGGDAVDGELGGPSYGRDVGLGHRESALARLVVYTPGGRSRARPSTLWVGDQTLCPSSLATPVVELPRNGADA
jgi:hypothetical protein